MREVTGQGGREAAARRAERTASWEGTDRPVEGRTRPEK